MSCHTYTTAVKKNPNQLDMPKVIVWMGAIEACFFRLSYTFVVEHLT